jgi:hypothetical protein
MLTSSLLGVPADSLIAELILKKETEKDMDNINRIEKVCVREKPETQSVCVPCCILKAELEHKIGVLQRALDDSRDRALLRQAALNVEFIFKESVMKALSNPERAALLGYQSIDQVKLKDIEAAATKTSVMGTALVELSLSEEQYKTLRNGAAKLKKLFSEGAHPLRHNSGALATRDSCRTVLAAIPNDEMSDSTDASAVLNWLATYRHNSSSNYYLTNHM